MQCASAIDHLATFYFENILMGESPASLALLSFAQKISGCRDYFLDVSSSAAVFLLFYYEPWVIEHEVWFQARARCTEPPKLRDMDMSLH